MANVTVQGTILRLSIGADVASASTLVLGDDGNAFDVTGTTTITGIASAGVGTQVILQFDDSLELIHSDDLVLPGGDDILTEPGDIGIFYEYESGKWRCVVFTRGPGGPQMVANSVYFDSSSSALARTNAITTDSRKFTLAGWIKLSVTSGEVVIASAGTTSPPYEEVRFTNGKISFSSGNENLGFNGQYNGSDVLFRDVSAWLPFCVVYDSTQATELDRIKFYYGLTQLTTYKNGPGTLSQNRASTRVNGSGATMALGYDAFSQFLRGYIADRRLSPGAK